MNAKFFDLKQEKQDRMVNAALKIFALNGYSHASTDDIVKEAHISKGLLFHYFDSKIGVYSFIYDYSVRFISLELSSAIDPNETSYFEILRQMEAAKMQVLKSYPYMFMFLNTCKKEDITEAVLAVETAKAQLASNEATILQKADESVKSKKNFSEYMKMLTFTINGIMESSLYDGSFNAEMNYKENIKYINLTESLLK
ncbi:MAG: TetR/AcrR family transcriptional regulator [Lachnospiraceae bacterium]|nr:TetR/AcrR family transcriptional regulator [Lachnospiraceae bacterium]MCR4934653.1 TetR/AcrR family transcriptional regulator [Lachnospiraceae bacterium]